MVGQILNTEEIFLIMTNKLSSISEKSESHVRSQEIDPGKLLNRDFILLAYLFDLLIFEPQCSGERWSIMTVV